MKIGGHAAIVTGAGSGLGKATAEALHRAGARILVIDQDEAAGKAAAESVGGVFAAADIADEAQMQAALKAGRNAHGPARILVNCAAIGGPPIRTAGKKGPYPLDVFRKLVEVNLIGTFNATRLAAADMLGLEPLDDNERGVIVLVSSINAFDAPVGTVAYTAAKAGVNGMTLTVARDLAPKGVRCCAIAPGNFDTPLLRLAPDEFLGELQKQIPFPSHRFGNPAEFAQLALHICENAMLNGEVIRLDGAVRHSQIR